MPISKEELIPLVDGKSKSEILGDGGILNTIVKNLLEAAMEAEMGHHLGYKKHESKQKKTSNSRNGHTSKRVSGSFGETLIDVPRDRDSSFEPKILPKNKRRFDGFDDQIIAMYARGMSTRDIQGHLKEIYGTEVSPMLISDVTERVIEDAKIWQNRALESTYPIVYFDALVVKVNENKRVINKAVHLALGVNSDGHKELLGVWITQNEGAKFWLQVLSELKNRGLEKMYIACVDGLRGFPEAIETIYPKAKIQLCIVHMVRNSLRYVPWKDKKIVATDLKAIYRAKTIDDAELALLAFEEKWGEKFPTIVKSWREHWVHIITYLDYPADIRKVIYTTNAIESVNMSIRKVIKNKRVFPNDDAVLRILYLAIQNISKKWTMPVQNWSLAMNQFFIHFEEDC